MSITWGQLKENAVFEQACLDQAKKELDFKANSGIDFIHKVLIRAQQIKLERKGEQ